MLREKLPNYIDEETTGGKLADESDIESAWGNRFGRLFTPNKGDATGIWPLQKLTTSLIDYPLAISHKKTQSVSRSSQPVGTSNIMLFGSCRV